MKSRWESTVLFFHQVHNALAPAVLCYSEVQSEPIIFEGAMSPDVMGILCYVAIHLTHMLSANHLFNSTIYQILDASEIPLLSFLSP